MKINGPKFLPTDAEEELANFLDRFAPRIGDGIGDDCRPDFDEDDDY